MAQETIDEIKERNKMLQIQGFIYGMGFSAILFLIGLTILTLSI